MHVTAIIAAAGRGNRLGKRKQLLDLLGKPVVAWCFETIARSPIVTDIIVACEADEIEDVGHLATRYCRGKIRSVVRGGDRRQDSVFAGLRVADRQTDYILVHDGARPFVTEDMIERAIDAARTSGAAVVAVSVKDTIKQVGEGYAVMRSLPREQLWSAQTPQAFAFDVLYKAYAAAEAEGFVATDDAMLVEWSGAAQVTVVEGSYDNLKITTPDDLVVAELIARRRAAEVR